MASSVSVASTLLILESWLVNLSPAVLMFCSALSYFYCSVHISLLLNNNDGESPMPEKHFHFRNFISTPYIILFIRSGIRKDILNFIYFSHKNEMGYAMAARADRKF